MFDLIANVLSFLYDINNSYVVAIVLLTLIVLVVATPLTLTGTKSMLKMQLLQPELKEIQNKYPKEERDAMNAELMEFYKDNQILSLIHIPSPRDLSTSRMPSSA